MFTQISEFISEHYPSLIGIIAFIAAWFKSRTRKPIKSSQGGSFLGSNELLLPPLTRPAYSDRMAYVMAEMSALAYFEFEKDSGAIHQTIDKITELKLTDTDDTYQQELEDILVTLRDELLVKSIDGKEVLAKLLLVSGFKLIDTIHYSDTQGFICKRAKPDEPEYLVIAFRGSELCVEDWLTNVQAKPKVFDNGAKVHSGFWQALHHIDANNKVDLPQHSSSTCKEPNVISQIKCILDSESQGAQQQVLPCYITGHSLGGALAVITTNELFKDINGACYTFGAPRLGNYEYFKSLKTPVFRVVNSADIVPRVPAGAATSIALNAIKGLKFLTQLLPSVSNIFKALEKHLDDLDDYRHYGDLRYLSDVKAGRFEDVQLLLNPPALDRLWWMYQHLRISFTEPVKSHGMSIYRSKLSYIAQNRNE
ncbi:MAG: lipase family protein [Psychromonas sp.]